MTPYCCDFVKKVAVFSLTQPQIIGLLGVLCVHIALFSPQCLSSPRTSTFESYVNILCSRLSSLPHSGSGFAQVICCSQQDNCKYNASRNLQISCTWDLLQLDIYGNHETTSMCRSLRQSCCIRKDPWSSHPHCPCASI